MPEFDIDWEDIPVEDFDMEEPERVEPKFKRGYYVYMKSINATFNEYGGEPMMYAPAYQKKIWIVRAIDPYDGAIYLKDDPNHYAYHQDDFRLATKTEIEYKKEQDAAVAVPSWVKPFPSQVMGYNSGYRIYWMTYRALRGDVKNPPSWDTLRKRYKAQFDQQPNGGYYGDRDGVRNDKPYTVFYNTNHYCWLRLRKTPSDFSRKHMWNGKKPNWFIFSLDLKPLSYEKNLRDEEVIKYVNLLRKYGCAPYDIDPQEWVDTGCARFRLKKYSIRYLFMMLVFLRYCHEQQWTVRHFLHLYDCGLNFWLAMAVAHFSGYGSCSNHAVLCSSEAKLNQPQQVLKVAQQLEEYVVKIAPTETAYLDERKGRFLGLQSTLRDIAKDLVDEVTEFDDLLNVKPQYSLRTLKK